MSARPWIDVQLWRYVLTPDQGWDSGKWDVAEWDAGYPAATEGWTSIACDVRGLNVQRGRRSVNIIGGTEAGTLLVELDNRDGQWSEFVEVSPGEFEPALSAGVQLRVVAGNDDVAQVVIFRGWVEEWVQDWSNGDDRVIVTVVDGWADLVQQGSTIEWTPGAMGEDVRQRIWRLLRMRAGWDEEQYPIRIQQGSVSLLGSSVYGAAERGLLLRSVSVADEIIRTAQSDGGTAFLDGDGSFVYLNRSRYTSVGAVPPVDQGQTTRPAQPTPIPLFGDYCGDPLSNELPYTDLAWEYRGAAPANIVVVANANPPSVRDEVGNVIPPAWEPAGYTAVADAFSARHRNVLSLGDLRYSTAAEGRALAEFYLAAYADKFLAISRLEIHPQLDDRLWTTVLGLRLGDHVRVLRRTKTNTIDLEAMIEGVRLLITPTTEVDDQGRHLAEWVVSYVTSDAVSMVSNFGVASKRMEEVAA